MLNDTMSRGLRIESQFDRIEYAFFEIFYVEYLYERMIKMEEIKRRNCLICVILAKNLFSTHSIAHEN